MTRKIFHLLPVAFFLLMVSMEKSVSAECFDISKNEPRILDGLLGFHIFPGPPNYENIKRGDYPEPTFILLLSKKICIEGNNGLTDTDNLFNKVHLVPTDQSRSIMKKLVGERVTVYLKDQTPSHTGHLHAPLVAWVEDISTDLDFTAEYGTATTVVRAFYQALHAADGDEAARFVIPEKRKTGPFSAVEITRFYGNLEKPLKILFLKQIDNNKFHVRYEYTSRQGFCNGSATVTTTKRSGENYIFGIRTAGGC